MSDHNPRLGTRRSHNVPNDVYLTFDGRRSLRHNSHSQSRSGAHPTRSGLSTSQTSQHRRSRSFSVSAATRRAMTIRLAQERSRQNSLRSQECNKLASDFPDGSSKVTFAPSPEYKSGSKAYSSKVAASFSKLSIGSFLKNTVKSITKSSPLLARRNSFSDNSSIAQNTIKGQDSLMPSPSKPNVKNQNSKDIKTMPGVVGIANHGNSCFINAVVQCLSNVPSFLEFILENCKYFEKPLTKSFANLIESLWLRKYNFKLSHKFRSSVALAFDDFVDDSQNDSQEFLLLLLDKIQQELSADKNIRNNGNSNAMNLIQRLFEVRMMSCLTCLRCDQNSFTADMQLTVCLPIQEPSVVRLIYVPITDQEKQCLYGFMINSCQTFLQLLEMASHKLKTHIRNITLVHVGDSGVFHEQKCLNSTVGSIMPFNYLFLVQLVNRNIPFSKSPSKRLPANNINSSHGNVRNGLDHNVLINDSHNMEEFVNIVALPIVQHGGSLHRFGSLISLDMLRTSSYFEIQMQLLNRMRQYFAASFFTMKNIHSTFRVRVYVPKVKDFRHHSDDNSKEEDFYLRSTDELPLFSLLAERALSVYDEGMYGTPHLRLIVEFHQDVRKYLLSLDQEKFFSKDRSYHELDHMYSYSNNVGCNLMNCLEAFTQQEQLDGDDIWMCNKCKFKRPGTLKTLIFTSLPEVLVIHLKRFKQEGDVRTKIETHVDFPISGLDLSRLVTKDLSSTSSLIFNNDSLPRNKAKLNKTWDSPFPDTAGGLNNNANDDLIYDLVAVCNHHGDLSKGHYTAFCKNFLSNTWYCFDDVQVAELQPNKIVSNSAYMLFYWRRGRRTSAGVDFTDWLSNNIFSNGIQNSTDSSQSLPSFSGVNGQVTCSLSLDNLASNQTSAASTSITKTNGVPLKSILKPSQSMSLSPMRSKTSHVTINEENLVDASHRSHKPDGQQGSLFTKPPPGHSQPLRIGTKPVNLGPSMTTRNSVKSATLCPPQAPAAKKKTDEVLRTIREQTFQAVASLDSSKKSTSLTFEKVFPDSQSAIRAALENGFRQRSSSQVVSSRRKSKLESTV